MPKKLEKINLKSMILTISLLSGLTLTSVTNLRPTQTSEVQKENRNPTIAEVIRREDQELEEDEII